MSNNSPSYYRARFAAFAAALGYENSLLDSREKQMRVSFLRNGFVPDSFLDASQNKTTYVFGESETGFETNNTIHYFISYNQPKYTNEPLTQTELQTLDTWFALHPEKVCGMQKGGTGYSFPIKTIGTKQNIIDAIDKTLNEKPTTTVIERSRNAVVERSRNTSLTLYKYKAKAIAIKLKLNNSLNGIENSWFKTYILKLTKFVKNNFVSDRKDLLNLDYPNKDLYPLNPNQPILMPFSVVKKGIEKHNLTIPNFEDIANAIHNPIAVFKSKTNDNGIVVLTEIRNKNGDKIMAAIYVDSYSSGKKGNVIASIYAKSDKTNIDLIKNAANKNELYFIDSTKIKMWLKIRGQLQLLPMFLSHATNIKQNIKKHDN